MRDFRVGDRVRFKVGYDNAKSGDLGTIADVYNSSIVVWWVILDGNSSTARIPMYSSELELISESPIPDWTGWRSLSAGK